MPRITALARNGVLLASVVLALGGPQAIGGEPASRPSTQPIVVPLWSGAVPNAVPDPGPERDDGDGRIWNVSVPAMLVYLPAPTRDSKPRMAIVHCPGGAYTHLTRLAGADGFVEEFLPRGVVVIALKYRLRPPSPDVERDAMADAQRAIRLVRHNARTWNIDPHRVGLVGASAGANVVLNVVSHELNDSRDSHDSPDQPGPSRDQLAITIDDPTQRQSARPDFVGLLSPWPDKHDASFYPIPKTAPPAFIASARDDRTAPSAFAQAVVDGYKAAGVPHQFWLIDTGGHSAFTLGGKGEGAGWVIHFWDWLAHNGVNSNGP